MATIERRIEQLEQAAGIHEEPTCIVVTDGPDESSEAAMARHRAEYPDTPERARFIVFVSGFAAKPADLLAVGGKPTTSSSDKHRRCRRIMPTTRPRALCLGCLMDDALNGGIGNGRPSGCPGAPGR